MIIGNRMVFCKYFTHNTYLWLPHIFINWYSLKILNNSLYIGRKSLIAPFRLQKLCLAAFHPLLVQLLSISLVNFIRCCPIFYIHQDITIYSSLYGINKAITGKFKGIRLQPPAGKHWNLRITGILQGLPQDIYVVGSPASPTSLKQHY